MVYNGAKKHYQDSLKMLLPENKSKGD